MSTPVTTHASTGRSVHAPDLVRHTLPNGLRIVVEEDRRLPLVAVNLRYDVGSRDERPGLTGFAHLFEHVMFEGSTNVAPGEHFAVLQAAGATLNATTSFDRTTYFQTVPSSHLDLVLWLEADRMGGLELTAETFDNQRDVVKNEKRQRYDNVPYGDAGALLHELAYPEGHPYRHLTIGSMADLDAASLADAQTFHRDWYAPNNCVLSVVGDVDAEHTLASAATYFGPIHASADVPDHPPPTLEPALQEPIRRTVQRDVPAAQLTVGIRVPRDDGGREHDAIDVLASALGRGRGSRLYRALVVEEALVQPSRTLVRCEHLHGDATLLIVTLRARTGVPVEQIEAALETVLADVARDGITDDELERVRVMMDRSFRAALTTVSSRADRYGRAVTQHDDLVHAFDTPARLAALTRGDIADAARRWLRPENRAVLTHLPRQEVRR